MRVPASEFQSLGLQVHDFMASVPLADVSAIGATTYCIRSTT